MKWHPGSPCPCRGRAGHWKGGRGVSACSARKRVKPKATRAAPCRAGVCRGLGRQVGQKARCRRDLSEPGEMMLDPERRCESREPQLADVMRRNRGGGSGCRSPVRRSWVRAPPNNPNRMPQPPPYAGANARSITRRESVCALRAKLPKGRASAVNLRITGAGGGALCGKTRSRAAATAAEIANSSGGILRRATEDG